MLEGRHFLLAVIYIIAAPCNQVAAEVPLDMALDAVDDMYKGCAKDALNELVFSDLFKKEMNKSEDLQVAWLHSQSRCSNVIPGGVKEHTTALQTYISADRFVKTLNSAVNTHGTNATIYEDNFHFKFLHFLLMDAIRLLHPKTCKTVYAFSEPKFSVQKGSRVRFGRFYTAYSNLNTLRERDFDDEVILNVTTCFFADLGKNICSDENITLFSPTEEFIVEDTRLVVEEDDSSYTIIVLQHSQLKSLHNCYIISRSPADVPSRWIVLALLCLSFFINS